jgi:hypothetical protein
MQLISSALSHRSTCMLSKRLVSPQNNLTRALHGPLWHLSAGPLPRQEIVGAMYMRTLSVLEYQEEADEAACLQRPSGLGEMCSWTSLYVSTPMRARQCWMPTRSTYPRCIFTPFAQQWSSARRPQTPRSAPEFVFYSKQNPFLPPALSSIPNRVEDSSR